MIYFFKLAYELRLIGSSIFMNVINAVKIALISCKNGDMTIIRINQPIKLSFGSYKINGIPKLAKSALGSHIISIMLPHIRIINNMVKAELNKAYLNILLYFLSKLEAYDLLVKYHPTGNPNSIQNTGTPIPKPTQNKSIMI